MKHVYNTGKIQINTNGKTGNMNAFLFAGTKKKKRRIKHGK